MLTTLLKKFGNKKSIVVIIIVALLGYAGVNNVSKTQISKVVDMFMTEDAPKAVPANVAEEVSSQKAVVKETFNRVSAVSKSRRTHILYGDSSGGGHLYGTGTPCKSEFPKSWSKHTVIKKIDLIAANDNLNWKRQYNGYYVAEQKVSGVQVRVVKGRQNKQVITAYPINTKRNPCPKTASYN